MSAAADVQAASRVLVTGANGHLGRRLISALAPHIEIEALVRSERARAALLRHIDERRACSVTVADPTDAEVLSTLGARCERVVHLIGTIRATRHNPLIDSHQRPAAAIAAAADKGAIKQLIYISILGADRHANSACLRARAMVEATLLEAVSNTTVIRVPMVIGERDRASAALARQAARRRVLVFRGASLEQPIYAGDLIEAVIGILSRAVSGPTVIDLAGPESLTRCELIRRAAATVARQPRVVSLPLACGLVFAAAFELLLSNPPLTRDMLRILDHDDAIDAFAAARTLGIELTALDETLRRCIPGRLVQGTI